MLADPPLRACILPGRSFWDRASASTPFCASQDGPKSDKLGPKTHDVTQNPPQSKLKKLTDLGIDFLLDLGANLTPTWCLSRAQDGPSTTKTAPMRPMTRPTRPQDATKTRPNRPQDGPRCHEDGPRRAETDPRTVQDATAAAREAPKCTSGRPKTFSKRNQDSCLQFFLHELAENHRILTHDYNKSARLHNAVLTNFLQIAKRPNSKSVGLLHSPREGRQLIVFSVLGILYLIMGWRIFEHLSSITRRRN